MKAESRNLGIGRKGRLYRVVGLSAFGIPVGRIGQIGLFRPIGLTSEEGQKDAAPFQSRTLRPEPLEALRSARSYEGRDVAAPLLEASRTRPDVSISGAFASLAALERGQAGDRAPDRRGTVEASSAAGDALEPLRSALIQLAARASRRGAIGRVGATGRGSCASCPSCEQRPRLGQVARRGRR